MLHNFLNLTELIGFPSPKRASLTQHPSSDSGITLASSVSWLHTPSLCPEWNRESRTPQSSCSWRHQVSPQEEEMKNWDHNCEKPEREIGPRESSRTHLWRFEGPVRVEIIFYCHQLSLCIIFFSSSFRQTRWRDRWWINWPVRFIQGLCFAWLKWQKNNGHRSDRTMGTNHSVEKLRKETRS